MKLGLHAVLFKEKIVSDTEKVLSQIQETGFAGAEIGSRFFGTEKKEYLKQMLKKYNVEMSGMHAAVLLKDVVDNRDAAFEGVMKVVSFVEDMPNKNVVMTGMNKLPEEKSMDIRLTDVEFVKEVAIGLNELARKAKAQGVQIHYHNHSWEFENNALIFHSLGKYAPDIGFALDTGWAFMAGYDPLELIEQYPDRFHYIHLRDYKIDSKEFVDLGGGNQDYTKMMKKLQEIMAPDDWAVVEYETGEEDYTRYTRAYEYVKKYI